MRVLCALASVPLVYCAVQGFAGGRAHPAGAQAGAITYAAAWNLIGGPDGAHAVGATGALYTLQAGDTGYESFPPDSPLHGAWGYWAYFPAGGSLDTSGATDAPDFTLRPVTGQYTMIGNPSATRTAVANSPLYTVYTYTPASGYQLAGTLAPGQGGWLTAAAQGDLVATPAVTPVAATPAPQPSPAATPTPTAAATLTPAPPFCAGGTCSFTGECSGTLTLAALGGFSLTTTLTFTVTVVQGQVSGQGQFVESFTIDVPACSAGFASGTVTVTGSLQSMELQLLFASGPIQRFQTCSGTTSPVQGAFGTLTILNLYQGVNVEARDGATGSGRADPAGSQQSDGYDDGHAASKRGAVDGTAT